MTTDQWLTVGLWLLGGLASVALRILWMLVASMSNLRLATDRLTGELRIHREEYAGTVARVDRHEQKLGEHDVVLARHGERLEDHERRLGGRK